MIPKLARQHCRLSICWNFGWVWQIGIQKIKIWWWSGMGSRWFQSCPPILAADQLNPHWKGHLPSTAIDTHPAVARNPRYFMALAGSTPLLAKFHLISAFDPHCIDILHPVQIWNSYMLPVLKSIGVAFGRNFGWNSTSEFWWNSNSGSSNGRYIWRCQHFCCKESFLSSSRSCQ